MTTPTPSPGARTVLFEGPLIVFPDGSLGVLISLFAFIVSATTLVYTLSARSRIRAHVVRNYVRLITSAVVDGDEVVIVNLGRSAAVIYDVRAATKDGGRLRAAEMKRGTSATPVAFPEMPQTLAPGAVLPLWFSSALAGEKAGIDHGYVITYTDTGGWRLGVGKQRELIVKV